MNLNKSMDRNDKHAVTSGDDIEPRAPVRVTMSFFEYLETVYKQPKESLTKEGWLDAWRSWYYSYFVREEDHDGMV